MGNVKKILAIVAVGASCCFNLVKGQTYSVTITQTTVINPKAKMLTGISYDARSSGYYAVGTNTFPMGYFSPATGTLLPGIQGIFNRIPMNGVRYPGNPEVFNWNWHYTIGPVASRTPQAMAMPSQTLAFGFDEFMSMVSSKGLPTSEVQIMVNLYASNGEPNPAILAADWVEYCNSPNNGSNPRGGIDWAALRAANGHTVPYGVKIWNIGNEPWGPSELGSTTAAANTFTGMALPIIDSMLKVDPTIQITLPSVGNGSSQWNAALLSSALVGKVWGLSPHNFYDELSSTVNPSINQCQALLVNLTAAAKAKGLKIIVGDNGHDCPQTDQDRGMKWRGGLATADWLIMASQLDNVDRANYWIYGAPLNTWHPIRKNGNGTYTFMSAAQIHETFGAKFLDKSVLTSVVDTSGAGVNQARAAVFFSNNGTGANVIVINTDTVLNKKIIAPSISGFALQKANLITAPNLWSDTCVTSIVSPLYNSTYSLPNTGVMIFEYATTAGIDQVSIGNAKKIDVYPNPVNDLLYFSEEAGSIEIYNAFGQKVLSQINAGNKVSVEKLSEGVYFVRTGNFISKFIVKH